MRLVVIMSLVWSVWACHSQSEVTQANIAVAGVSLCNTDPGVAAMLGATPKREDVMYASKDGGKTWGEITGNLPEKVFYGEVLHTPDGDLMMGSPEGLFKANMDQKDITWNKSLLMNEEIHGLTEGIRGVYALSYGAGLFQNVTGTEMWMPLLDGLKDKLVRTVLDLNDGSTILVVNSGIYKSTDDCRTWQLKSKTMAPHDLRIASDGSLVGLTYRMIVRSTDNGEHWEQYMKVGDAFGFMTRIGGQLAYMQHSDEDNWQIRSLETGTANTDFLKSLNAGINQLKDISSLIEFDGALFCGHSGGISRSEDGGKTWQLVIKADDDKGLFVRNTGSLLIARAGGYGC